VGVASNQAARATGSTVFFSNVVTLESLRQRDNFVHVSATQYDTLRNVHDSTLPMRLRTGKVFETNLSTQLSSFRLHSYARFGVATEEALKTGEGFRLFHSQSDSFVQASNNPDKVPVCCKTALSLSPPADVVAVDQRRRPHR
jgi:hypothetical protein